MADIRDNLKLILEKLRGIKAGQSLLMVTDPLARARLMAYNVAELANSMGSYGTNCLIGRYSTLSLKLRY
ncbi:hypothetical protein ACFLVW_02450 [Chloroflexota bacterium]